MLHSIALAELALFSALALWSAKLRLVPWWRGLCAEVDDAVHHSRYEEPRHPDQQDAKYVFEPGAIWQQDALQRTLNDHLTCVAEARIAMRQQMLVPPNYMGTPPPRHGAIRPGEMDAVLRDLQAYHQAQPDSYWHDDG